MKYLNYGNVFSLKLKDLQLIFLYDTLCSYFFLFHPGICDIHIMEVFHFSSMWPPTCIDRKQIQVRPAISYIWVQLKFDQQWRSTHCSVFSVHKNVTQCTYWKRFKNSLAHRFLGTEILSKVACQRTQLLIYSSSLGSETQTQVFNYQHSHSNLTQHKLCRMLNPPFHEPVMAACSEHSLEPAKQERITPRTTGSSSPERALLCRPIKKGSETICVNSLNHRPQLALPLKHLHAPPCKAGARYVGIQITSFGGPPMPLAVLLSLIAGLQTLSLGSSRNWPVFASRFGTLLFHHLPVLLSQGAACPPHWVLWYQEGHNM